MLAAFCCLVGLSFHAIAGNPVVTTIAPRGGTRGTDVQVTFYGERLKDVDGLIFYGEGLAAKSIDAREDGKAAVTITVATNAPLGPQMVRVRTKTGVSHARLFSVGAYPSVAEVEPNNDFAHPQRIELGTTVEGVTQDEDVDHYVFTAKKGQWVSAEVECMRLGPPDGLLTDVYVAILNSNRFELAINDDNALLGCDPAVTVQIPEDGDYVMQVRDAAYEGNDNARYRAHLGLYRRPFTCYPAGGKVGEKLKVRFIDGKETFFEQEIELPPQANEAYAVFPEFEGHTPPSPNYLRVSPGPNVLEVEPNDDAMQNATPGGDGICALNGILQKPGDVDCFKLKLGKDQEVVISAYGRGVGSPVDPVLELLKPDGSGAASNDDMEGGKLDSRLTFKAPVEGEYRVRIQDKMRAGGPEYVYRIEVETPKQQLAFSSPQFANNDSQQRQWYAIPRGGRIATMLNVSRERVGGDIRFDVTGLPPGVKLVEPAWPERFGAIPILFEAAADAPLGGATAVLTAEAKMNPPFVGRLRQTFNFCYDGNQRVFHSRFTDRIPLAVCDEAPYSLEIEKSAVPLLREGDLALKVRCKRKEGFTKPIQVYMEWRPNGVNGLGEATIPEGQNECTFPLQAGGGAELGVSRVVVLGASDTGYGIIWNASPYQEITVAEPFVSGKIEMVALERPNAGRMLCPLQVLRPFEGKAHARVLAVPTGVTVSEVDFDKDAKQIEFAVQTKPDSPLGKHENLFVALEIPMQGGVALQKTAYRTSLRIDDPPKVPVAAAASAPAPAPVPAPVAANPAPLAAPVEKPLSRLEQLRRRAKNGGK